MVLALQCLHHVAVGGGREFVDANGGTEAAMCVLRETHDREVRGIKGMALPEDLFSARVLLCLTVQFPPTW